MRRAAPLFTMLLVVLALAATAGASNATLRTTINRWSLKVGADARAVAVDAQQHHPRRMTSDATRFRGDALRARAATAARHASTAKGADARRLALGAFSAYAVAGSRWAASGRARLAHHRARAAALATAGARYARRGNSLLVSAGKLLR
ncbi:MAG: hypothetical protein V7644_1774 [Actinomycetota bacterium]